MSEIVSKLFKVSARDIQNLIAPHSSRHQVMFSIGEDEDDDISTEDCIDIVNQMESVLLSQLGRSKYRQRFRRIDGEVLTWSSLEGVQSYTSKLNITANTAVVYVDYFGGWSIRTEKDAYDPTGYVITSNNIVFSEAPSAGSRIVIEYNHEDAHKFNLPRSIVIRKSVVELFRRYNFASDDASTQRFEDWEQQATAQTLALGRGEIGVAELDDIPFVYESNDQSQLDFLLRLRKGMNGRPHG
jgi:hypothetical protein